MKCRLKHIDCNIKECKTPDEIKSTFSVMQQLRPNIKAEDYLDRVDFLIKKQSYRLLAAYNSENHCVGVIGFQLLNRLHLGNIIYIADLVTDEAQRSNGIGSLLINRIKEEAIMHGVDAIVLESGMQRKKAHKFYESHGYKAESYSFRIFKPFAHEESNAKEKSGNIIKSRM
jgi:GNAT superfamily N-acetyltransferase